MYRFSLNWKFIIFTFEWFWLELFFWSILLESNHPNLKCNSTIISISCIRKMAQLVRWRKYINKIMISIQTNEIRTESFETFETNTCDILRGFTIIISVRVYSRCLQTVNNMNLQNYLFFVVDICTYLVVVIRITWIKKTNFRKSFKLKKCQFMLSHRKYYYISFEFNDIMAVADRCLKPVSIF